MFVSSLVPGAPTIISENVDLTWISLKWKEPQHPNGVILNYNVCWHLIGEASKKCRIENNTPTVDYKIPNLKPGTLYVISILAFTTVGGGDSETIKLKTLESGK